MQRSTSLSASDGRTMQTLPAAPVGSMPTLKTTRPSETIAATSWSWVNRLAL